VGKVVSLAKDSVKLNFYPPRALFITGSLARGIQLSTALAYTFQPSLGIGALMNVLAIGMNERWITCVAAGWFSSATLWTFFGAKAPVANPKLEDASMKKGWFQ